MKKSLVAYFSATAVTKHVAEELAAAINADLFEIVPVKEYSDEDWNMGNILVTLTNRRYNEKYNC